jgi:hypothetical protein
MDETMSTFAGVAVALYAAHHVGDYWVQTDHQARHKGDAGREGAVACLKHVAGYLFTQTFFLAMVVAVTGVDISALGLAAALLVSGGTHYLADRREHGVMLKLARLIPGKDDFLKLGVPRKGVQIEIMDDCETCKGRGTSFDESTGGKCWDCQGGGKLPHWIGDNPSLGTGAWALDQAWHVFWGVFVSALLIAGLS